MLASLAARAREGVEHDLRRRGVEPLQGAQQVAQVAVAQRSLMDALDADVGIAIDEDEHVLQAVCAAGRAHEQVEDAVGILGVEVRGVEIGHGAVAQRAHAPEGVAFGQQAHGVVAGVQDARRGAEAQPVDGRRPGFGRTGVAFLIQDGEGRLRGRRRDGRGLALFGQKGREGGEQGIGRLAQVRGGSLRGLEQGEDVVLGRKRQGEQLAGHRQHARAHAVEHGFHVVGEAGDLLEAEHGPAALDGVHGPEAGVHALHVAGVFLEFEQGPFQFAEQFPRFFHVEGDGGIDFRHGAPPSAQAPPTLPRGC